MDGAKPSFSNESIAQGPNLLASLPKRTAMIATITTGSWSSKYGVVDVEVLYI